MSKHKRELPTHSGSEDFRTYCDNISEAITLLFGTDTYLDELDVHEFADQKEQRLIFTKGIEAGVCELLATIVTEGSSDYVATRKASEFGVLPSELIGFFDRVRSRVASESGWRR